MLEGTPELKMLRENTIAIEQPLERSIALEPAHTDGHPDTREVEAGDHRRVGRRA